jgi:hypothetical protein
MMVSPGDSSTFQGLGHVVYGSQLGDPDPGDHPGGADGPRTDPDLHRIRPDFGQVPRGLCRTDVAQYDVDLVRQFTGAFKGIHHPG